MFRSLIFASCALWSLALSATTFELADDSTKIVGHNLIVFSRHEDTLLDIGRRFDLGYSEIVNANPDVDPWLPGEGTRVLVPNQFILPNGSRKGIVVNLAEMRLYYYPVPKKGERQKVITYPLGVGREGWTTPLGKTRIIQKVKNPTWTPPASILAEHLEKGDPLPKVVPAGPDNPLGAYKMRLAMPGYLIHGTNKPYGVGLRVSHGCIRLYPEDIEQLFAKVAVNTPVEIIYKPDKATDYKNNLYLEAHQVQEDIDSREGGNNMTSMVKAIVEAQKATLKDDDWSFVENVVKQHNGVVTKLHQTGSDIVENVWFVHAGLGYDVKSLLRNALAELKLDMYFWPLQDNAATEEALLGPFESYEQARTVADNVAEYIGRPAWVVLMGSDIL